MITHEELVNKLVKPGVTIKAELTPNQAHLWHMVSGVCGESGELMDAFKKWFIYGKKLDLDNVVEELGDLEFYLQGIRSALKISREEVLNKNIEKLSKRYEKLEYSDKAAINRKDKEMTGEMTEEELNGHKPCCRFITQGEECNCVSKE